MLRIVFWNQNIWKVLWIWKIIKAYTFGGAIEGDVVVGQQTSNGGDIDDASAASEGGIKEERMRELAKVEARLQVDRHATWEVFRRALRHRFLEELCRIVHLCMCKHVYITTTKMILLHKMFD